jgi:phosphoketolase
MNAYWRAANYLSVGQIYLKDNPPYRLAELPVFFTRLVAGPQRLQPPGPRLHGSSGEQEGRSG